MTPRIRPLVPTEMSAEQRALYDAITAGPRAKGPQHFPLTTESGALRGPFDGFLRSPDVGDALQGLGAAIRFRTEFTDRCREIAILLVAAHGGCGFERDAHEAVGLAVGLTADELAAARRLDTDAFAGEERVLARTVLQLLDGDLDDSHWQAAQNAFGERGVFELVALVGYYQMLALQLRVFRTDD